jgi:ubiquitin-protein ligase
VSTWWIQWVVCPLLLCCPAQVLLSEPNTDHSLQPELAKLYDTDRAAFNKAAREHTKRHAM